MTCAPLRRTALLFFCTLFVHSGALAMENGGDGPGKDSERAPQSAPQSAPQARSWVSYLWGEPQDPQDRDGQGFVSIEGLVIPGEIPEGFVPVETVTPQKGQPDEESVAADFEEVSPPNATLTNNQGPTPTETSTSWWTLFGSGKNAPAQDDEDFVTVGNLAPESEAVAAVAASVDASLTESESAAHLPESHKVFLAIVKRIDDFYASLLNKYPASQSHRSYQEKLRYALAEHKKALSKAQDVQDLITTIDDWKTQAGALQAVASLQVPQVPKDEHAVVEEIASIIDALKPSTLKVLEITELLTKPKHKFVPQALKALLEDEDFWSPDSQSPSFWLMMLNYNLLKGVNDNSPTMNSTVRQAARQYIASKTSESQ